MRLFLVLSTLAAFVAVAQEPAAPPRQADTRAILTQATSPLPSPTRVGVGITRRELRLAEAVEMALSNNLDIEIERTARDTAEQNIQVARGFFDPAFRWTPLFERRNTPVGNVFQGSGGKLTDRFLNNNLTIRQRLPRWGTLGQVDWFSYRQTTTNPFTNFNPAITSQLSLGVTQPLVRGFRIDRERAEIRIREKRAGLSAVDLETRIIDVVSRVEQSYFDLVAAREAVGVARDVVALAREQLETNNRLVAAGTLAQVEISAAEAELQRRVDSWYSMLGSLTEVENALKLLIAPERTSSLWSDEIVPTDTTTLQPAIEDLHEAIRTAIATRPELRALSVRSEINGVEKQLNQNLRKPEVSLVGQYALSGLAGTLNTAQNPLADLNVPLWTRMNELSTLVGWPTLTPANFGTVPDFLIGNYGTAMSNLFGGRYQSFQVGVALDLNLRNRAADAGYTQTLINEKRIRLERMRAEQTIEAQVRNALQGIETARQRISAAEASAQAAQVKLESEKRLFGSGESTNFLVLTRQNEYADSRRRAVVARLDFNKSVARLQQALGTTLSTHKISVR